MTEATSQWIYWMLESSRGGAGSIQQILDNQAAMLDLARSPNSGTTTMTGGEDNLYPDGGTEPHPYWFGGGFVDLTNMQAGDTIRLRLYVRNRAGGGLVQVSVDAAWTFNGVQTEPMKQFTGFYNQYGFRITALQSAGVNRDVYHEWFDAMRGS